MEIEATILYLIRQRGHYGPDDSTSILESKGYDSLVFVDLIADIEKYFEIELNLIDYEPEFFTTARGLVHIVSSLTKGC